MSGLATKDRILRTALQLFSSRGYDGTSVRELCQVSGITKPTLYHFFGSKEGLYRALVDDSLEGFSRELKETIAHPGTTEERLGRVARHYFGSVKEHQDLMRFIFALVHGRPSSAPATNFFDFNDQLIAAIARIVDEGVVRGELSPGDTSLRLLVFGGALGEALTQYVLTGQPDLTPTLADSLVGIILQGWR